MRGRHARAADGAWTEHADPLAVPGPGGAWVAENMYIEEMRGFLHAIESGQEHWPHSLDDDMALLGTLVELEAASERLRRWAVVGEPG